MIKTLTPILNQDIHKLEYLEKLASVHQYAGETGQYTITDSDRTLVKKEMAKVTQVMNTLEHRLLNLGTYSKDSKNAIIGFVEEMGDGTTLAIEAIQKGRKGLAIITARKFVKGSNVNSKTNPNLYAKNGTTANEPVASIDDDTATMPDGGGFKDMITWIMGVFDEQGNKAVHPTLGEVTLDEKSIKNSLAYKKNNPHTNLVFEVIKDVIEQGELTAKDTISALVTINGKEHIMTVITKHDGNNKYVHEITVTDKPVNSKEQSIEYKTQEVEITPNQPTKNKPCRTIKG